MIVRGVDARSYVYLKDMTNFSVMNEICEWDAPPLQKKGDNLNFEYPQDPQESAFKLLNYPVTLQFIYPLIGLLKEIKTFLLEYKESFLSSSVLSRIDGFSMNSKVLTGYFFIMSMGFAMSS